MMYYSKIRHYYVNFNQDQLIRGISRCPEMAINALKNITVMLQLTYSVT